MITVLVRYGAVPEVARARADGGGGWQRGQQVVVLTHRGEELGTILEAVSQRGTPPAADGETELFEVLRTPEPADLERARQLKERAQAEFRLWTERIAEWNLDLQLIDMEWTLDESRQVLYVLNERGPECTRLALQAAAAGLGIIEVQPVSMDGLVTQPKTGGGGCGSGGSCGCG